MIKTFSKILRSAIVALLLIGLQSSPVLSADNLPGANNLNPVEACNLPAPDNFHVTSTTTTSISTAWNPVAGAAGYWITVRQLPSNTLIYDGPVATTTFSLTNGTPNTQYSFGLSTVCPNGDKSAPVTILGQTDFIVITDLITQLNANPTYPLTTFTIPANTLYTGVFQVRNTNTSENKNFIFKTVLTNPPNQQLYVGIQYNTTGLNSQWWFMDESGMFPFGTQQVYADKFVTVKHLENGIISPVVTLIAVLLPSGEIQLSWELASNVPGWTVMLTNQTPPVPGGGSPGGDGSHGLVRSHSPISTAQIAPNPFTSNLSLYLEHPAVAPSTLSLYDINGRIVLEQNIEEGTMETSIETETLQPGMYMARFESPEGVQTMKVIKQQ